MIPSDFSDLRRYTWRDYRRSHTDADCGGFSDLAYVYATSDDSIVISCDETEHSCWYYRLLIPEGFGYAEILSNASYDSPAAAFEVARAALAIFEREGEHSPHMPNICIDHV